MRTDYCEKPMFKYLVMAFAIALSLGAGYLSSILQADALADWYPTLNISPLSPPNWMFPVVWTILYILMGISVGLLCDIKNIFRVVLMAIFVVQLLMNIAWSSMFFYHHSPTIAFICIIFLDILAAIYIALCYVFKPWAAWLQVPYMLWLLFATYLNGYVAMYNSF